MIVDLDDVHRLVEEDNVNVEAETENGWRPLIVATPSRHVEVVKYLLQRGAEVDAKDREGSTALWFAAREGHLEIAKLLVENGSKSVNEAEENGWTPLWWAARNEYWEMARWLLEIGADAKTKAKDGTTALLRICRARNVNVELVKEVVDAGADVNSADKEGFTPLMVLCAQVELYADLVTFFVKDCGADVNAVNSRGRTALMFFCDSVTCSADLIKFLVENGADINAADNDGWTPLTRICCYGRADADVVKVLVHELGADVNARNSTGLTVLMLLCQFGHVDVDVLKVLVCGGVDVNAADRDGSTALMHFCEQYDPKEKNAEFLVKECGANVNAADNDRHTALMHLYKSGSANKDFVNFLVKELSAKINAVDTDGRTLLMQRCASGNADIDVVKLLAGDISADVNAADIKGKTVLMHLCGSGKANVDVVKTLVEKYGAAISAIDIEGWTALMHFCSSKVKGSTKALLKFLVVDHGADVNAAGNDGRTPLMVAAECGNTKIVRYLLQLNAASNATDKFNRTARDYAVRGGHRQVQMLLIASIKQNQLHTSYFIEGDPPQWLIRATEVEVGDFSVANVGEDFTGTWLDSQVVLKLYDSSPDVSISFSEHVSRWFSLRHPNVQKLYGAVYEGYTLFVCEHMTKGSLKDYIEFHRRLWIPESIANAVEFVYEAALGLQFLHERGIVHGDVRLENVLIGGDGIARLTNVCITNNSDVMNKHINVELSLELDVVSLGKALEGLHLSLGVHREWRTSSQIKQFGNLVEDMLQEDPQKRCTIGSVVNRLKIHLGMLNSGLHQARAVSTDDIGLKLEGLREMVDDTDDPLHGEMLSILDTICEQMITPNSSMSEQTHEHVLSVLENIEFAVDQQWSRSNNPIQRLSSRCAADWSLDFFRKQMERLLNAFEAPRDAYDYLQKRWADLYKFKIEEFVSEVDQSLTLLHPTNSEDILTLLQRELQNKICTAAHLEVIRKALDNAMSVQATEIHEMLLEWFIGWYELENQQEFAHGGFGEVSQAKWLNSDVIVKKVILDDVKRREERQMFQHGTDHECHHTTYTSDRRGFRFYGVLNLPVEVNI